MKIRNRRKKEYVFHPHENSKLNKNSYVFKRKSKLIGFLTSNLTESINGKVHLNENYFCGSGTLRMWEVWYNDKQYRSGAQLKAELRQLDFRGKKYVHKSIKVSKEDKKYFAFSDKIISLMCNIENEKGIISPNSAKNLVSLFKKRGFKDFEPSEEDWTYINGHISDGIDFSHWSDRCNWLRTKTIIEYFKIKNLILK